MLRLDPSLQSVTLTDTGQAPAPHLVLRHVLPCVPHQVHSEVGWLSHARRRRAESVAAETDSSEFDGDNAMLGVKWRCPGCQAIVEKIPKVLLAIFEFYARSQVNCRPPPASAARWTMCNTSLEGHRHTRAAIRVVNSACGE